MFRSKKVTVSVAIADAALEAIFDECDKYNVDETGGKIIGTYRQKGSHYDIDVLGVIGPGPNAERSPTRLFQDGEYQEAVFRSIEASHPTIEHLGSWHTHHVNGYPTLSGGDKTTYFKIVNHKKHNIEFFYALLVVHKNKGVKRRYDIKHFFFRRGDDTVYEIPGSEVKLVDTPALWPLDETDAVPAQPTGRQLSSVNLERAKDQEFFTEFYPGLKAMLSKDVGTPYWKGSMPLIDGSSALVVAMENTDGSQPYYSAATAEKDAVLASVSAKFKNQQFRSARHALINLERSLNEAIYRHRKA
jgi:hypothetical protein